MCEHINILPNSVHKDVLREVAISIPNNKILTSKLSSTKRNRVSGEMANSEAGQEKRQMCWEYLVLESCKMLQK